MVECRSEQDQFTELERGRRRHPISNPPIGHPEAESKIRPAHTHFRHCPPDPPADTLIHPVHMTAFHP
ncbi:MAG: hypothetical protein JWN03_3016 [Nocardia sp.]|nr:hypothetical protein [Nocardia sp.]